VVRIFAQGVKWNFCLTAGTIQASHVRVCCDFLRGNGIEPRGLERAHLARFARKKGHAIVPRADDPLCIFKRMNAGKAISADYARRECFDIEAAAFRFPDIVAYNGVKRFRRRNFGFDFRRLLIGSLRQRLKRRENRCSRQSHHFPARHAAHAFMIRINLRTCRQ
jgi:hypothetical protein